MAKNSKKKGPTKKSATRRQQPGTAATARRRVSLATAPATIAGACKLRRRPGTGDFEAPAGSTVTLFTRDHVGNVLLAHVEYGGQKLVPAGQAVSRVNVQIKAGRHALKAVFVFTALTAGRGELREDCGNNDSSFLLAARGDEPLQVFDIFGV